MQAVDTLKAFEDLKAAELTEAQAKAIASVVRSAYNAWLDRLVTKDDLRHTEDQLRLEIREAKLSLLKWLVPIIIGQGSLVVTIIKLLK